MKYTKAIRAKIFRYAHAIFKTGNYESFGAALKRAWAKARIYLASIKKHEAGIKRNYIESLIEESRTNKIHRTYTESTEDMIFGV